jgi:hypothetical protein
MMRSSSVLLACLLLQVAAQGAKQAAAQGDDQWEQKVDEQGRQVQSLKIEAPAMTEEDQYGHVMPQRYRCDSCKAVVFHLADALKAKQPKNRRLKEWEYQEVFEDTCKTGFKGYGVTLINGENALNGPGLQQRDNIAPGGGAIQMGGETWEKRLGELCRQFVFEKIGEEELYEHFRTRGTISNDLCVSETKDCAVGPHPPAAAKPAASKAKKEKKEKKEKKPKQMDLQAFFGSLAGKHGQKVEDYTRKRTAKEWEDFLVEVAGKVSAVSEKKTEAYEV